MKVKQLIKEAEDLSTKAFNLSINCEPFRKMELNNIRSFIKSSIFNLKEFGSIDGEDEIINEARIRLIELEENPKYAGKHNIYLKII